MKTPLPSFLAAILVAAAAASGLFGCSRHEEPVAQPIPFSHAKHISGKDSPKLACTECHTGAETRASAGLPSLDRCLQCHMKPQSKSEREAVVREIAARGGPFEWKPVTRNAAHVYVSHRAHVSIGKMQCATCHGDVASWDAPPTSPNRKLMSMDRCLECHRERGAPTACAACHR